jgi:transcriptional regulator with PAS, ATPase and Fis domain
VIELAAVMYEGNEIHEENITFISLEKEGPSLMDEMTLREYTLKIIRHFLNKNDNHVLLVASKLDIGKSSIYRYLIEMEDNEM